MATFSALDAFDIGDFSAIGDAKINGDTKFTVEGSGTRVILNGSYTLAGQTIQSGTVKSVTFFTVDSGGKQVKLATLTGATADAAVAWDWAEQGEAGDLWSVIFGKADTLAGSGKADVLSSFGGSDKIVAKAGNDQLDGGDGNDTLDGGVGRDTMSGGAGNDSYLVDRTLDSVIEGADGGIDSVQATANFTLPDDVENLTLGGTGALTGTGNSGDNKLTGNAGANLLLGLEGNDSIDGLGGIDTMAGGTGDDLYVATSADIVLEAQDEGLDRVRSAASYTLGTNLEELELTGSAAANGVGNTLDNLVIGNAAANQLSGLAGADTLDGGAGADTLLGGAGNDTLVVDSAADVVTENAGEGTDTVLATVSLALGANIENLTLGGNAGIDGTGNALANVITGNDAANVLNGAGGADSMIGGGGNDTYVVEQKGDVVAEEALGGTDTVRAAIHYTLGSNVENLVLTGTAALNGTGNDLDNVMTGNSGANVLDGGAGADEMSGGGGGDTYIVEDEDDVAIENAGQGNDLVRSSVSYVLGANIENLELTGDAGAGTGNDLANYITGNGADNQLAGLAGNDTIDGGAGKDAMSGGAGDDTYLVADAGDVAIENADEGSDFVFSTIDYTLGANVENLWITSNVDAAGTGNDLANRIFAGEGDDVLDGKAGADTLVGGKGDDSYVVDNAGDFILENVDEGVDTVRANASYTLGANLESLVLTGNAAVDGTGNEADNLVKGNGAANKLAGADGRDTLVGGSGGDNLDGGSGKDELQGEAGNDTLDGGAGADVMAGGLGNDTYQVDEAEDEVVEEAGAGTDTVRSAIDHTLSSTLENLVLVGAALAGTGNAAANVLTGNAQANVLDGAEGADAMSGGAGNDRYIVDNAGDTVTEAAGNGNDTVESAVDFTLGANIETLLITSGEGRVAAGNGQANTLVGNSGNDTLNGGAGADAMKGLDGDDTYVVDDAGDTIDEALTGGTDTVRAAISYTLAATLEKLVLTGNANLSGTGTDNADVLVGNAGNNTLDGGAGADSMAGGAGDDVYVVDDAADPANGDEFADTVTESANEGTDTVRSSVAYTLGANVENLELTGSAGLAGTGNELTNTLTGTVGDDTLDGAAAADTLNGGDGHDSLLGGAGIDQLNGGAGNDTMDGGAGVDVMNGGLGDDTYVIDQLGETLNDAGGTDTVASAVSFTLGAGFEKLTLTGTDNINGTGNTADNVIVSNAGNNFIDGGAGSDTVSYAGIADKVVVNLAVPVQSARAGGTDSLISIENATGGEGNDYLAGSSGANVLDGGHGADTMVGGLGDDTLVVDDAADVATELAGQGTDTVRAAVNWGIDPAIEKLVLVGEADLYGYGNSVNTAGSGNNDVTGNDGNNELRGYNPLQEYPDDLKFGISSGNDTLSGGNGDDTLWGGDGVDLLIGGAGSDSFVFSTRPDGVAVATITDFNVADDKIMLDVGVGTDSDPAYTRFAALAPYHESANAPGEGVWFGHWTSENFRIGGAAADSNDFILYDSASGRLYYDADAGGAGAAVVFAILSPNLALTDANFELFSSV